MFNYFRTKIGQGKIKQTVEEALSQAPTGFHPLPLALYTAVPLWCREMRELGPEGREQELIRLQESDLCLRMEYVLFRGPKKGDSARAFNDLAKAIAILSFCPGGVKVFGVRYESKDNVQNL